MPQLLHVDSSADVDASCSRELTRLFADTWRGRGPEFTVVDHTLLPDTSYFAMNVPAANVLKFSHSPVT